MKIKKIDMLAFQNYINAHKDESIIDVFNSIKAKKLKDRTTEENLVYTYLYMNRKKLGIK